MKLIKPFFELMEQQVPVRKLDDSDESYKLKLIDSVYKQIELAGRTCYKSTDKITDESAKPFVDRMIASQHYAMLEHGTVYLSFDMNSREKYFKYCYNKYSKAVSIGDAEKCTWNGYATTNLRVLVENEWLEDLQYICVPTEYHKKRHAVKFISDIHFYKDTTRHRPFSWAIESTRFCNYLKEKFGMSVTFAEPCWLEDSQREEFEKDLETVEKLYFKWLDIWGEAQKAAYFLIQGTKAEIIMTGFEDEFKHFFDLRADGTTGKPHPTVQELAKPLKEEFIKQGWYECRS